MILQPTRYSALTVVDPLGSVLGSLEQSSSIFTAYMPFGHSRNNSPACMAFTGQWREKQGSYLLGNGRRSFLPTLMRFSQPDHHSPFGKGGINAYGYCEGQPVTKSDPTGCSSRTKAMLRFSLLGASLFGFFTAVTLTADKKQPVVPALAGLFTMTAIASGIGWKWRRILQAQPGIRKAVDASANIATTARTNARNGISRLNQFPAEFYERRGGVVDFLYHYNPFNGPYFPRKGRITGLEMPVHAPELDIFEGYYRAGPAGGAYVDLDQFMHDYRAIR
ncbi:RHS repeat-associated core domain-containing protein [Pseudomonas sp. Marseille-Q5115]|uniref:RHS repeat-associated core domain-containing protein n=1 Tax=Pseudomonas sp. Marseille-Q5115 TaxID=2866593 RepID=UPI001CE43C8C|nr:RHS repeat-associated core domain-containing protein [Pseudomonas sp. Marseille-Q5115]